MQTIWCTAHPWNGKGSAFFFLSWVSFALYIVDGHECRLPSYVFAFLWLIFILFSSSASLRAFPPAALVPNVAASSPCTAAFARDHSSLLPRAGHDDKSRRRRRGKGGAERDERSSFCVSLPIWREYIVFFFRPVPISFLACPAAPARFFAFATTVTASPPRRALSPFSCAKGRREGEWGRWPSLYDTTPFGAGRALLGVSHAVECVGMVRSRVRPFSRFDASS